MALHVDDTRLRKLLRAYPVGAVRLMREFYYDKLYSMAHRLTDNPDAAEYLVNDTFLFLHTHYKDLEEDRGYTLRHCMVRVVRSKTIVWYGWQGYDEWTARGMII